MCSTKENEISNMHVWIQAYVDSIYLSVWVASRLTGAKRGGGAIIKVVTATYANVV